MTWTCHAASAEWGIDRKTLKTRLATAGHDLSKKKNFTTQEIDKAIHSSEKVERIKGLQFDNELKAIEIAEKKKELFDSGVVMKMMGQTYQPIRDLLNELPAKVASRANPTDPQLAREALMEWLKEILPKIRGIWPATQVQTEEKA